MSEEIKFEEIEDEEIIDEVFGTIAEAVNNAKK